MMRAAALMLVACALVLLVPPAFAQTPAASTPPATQAPPTEPPPEQPTLGDDKDTIEAGQKWLALIDAGKADAAWDSASKQLQSVVKRDKFVAEMRDVRKPLGKLASRTAVKFARAHDLPGAPAGDYAIVEYDVNFAGGKRLSEQLVWSLEENDRWRVAGYYYR
ncbi:MAG TPA: DUF4019 domain-containing protein [Casimicrobiaceae bacterium]